MPRLILGRHSRTQFSTMASCFMFLTNVNDTIKPHEFDNQPLPAADISNTECYSADNCTSANGQAALSWSTYYPTFGTCENPNYSSMSRQQDFGVCTNFYNLTYAKTGCFDSEGSYIAHFKDAACTDPISAFGERKDCHTSSYQTHCNAPVTPVPGLPGPGPAPELSAASPFQLSFLLGLVALIALSAAF